MRLEQFTKLIVISSKKILNNFLNAGEEIFREMAVEKREPFI
jgi:hypothetical protein